MLLPSTKTLMVKILARAFVWNQTVYQAGSVLGPLIGGYLAQPCQRFSGFCSAGSLLDAYPFALPNLVLCTVTAMSFITGFFFIQEVIIPIFLTPLLFPHLLVSFITFVLP